MTKRLAAVILICVLAGCTRTVDNPRATSQASIGPITAGQEVRSVVAGVLICMSGVAMLLVAKNGLAGADGWVPLACFLVGVLAARACA